MPGFILKAGQRSTDRCLLVLILCTGERSHLWLSILQASQIRFRYKLVERRVFMLKLGCRLAIVILFAGMVNGCGGNSAEVPDELIPVSGTVKLNGEPASNITVIFNPGKGTVGTGGYGVTDSTGKYTVTHRSNKLGIEPGEYVVTFSKMGLPDGSPIPEGKDAADVGAVQLLPNKYTNPNREMNLTIATVKSPAATLDYEITSKK